MQAGPIRRGALHLKGLFGTTLLRTDRTGSLDLPLSSNENLLGVNVDEGTPLRVANLRMREVVPNRRRHMGHLWEDSIVSHRH